MPGALHVGQVLGALEHYGHSRATLKARKTDVFLFTVYLLFLMWGQVLQCLSCFILTQHEKSSFSSIPLMLKLGKRPCFFQRAGTVLNLSSLLCSTAILSSLLVNLNLQVCPWTQRLLKFLNCGDNPSVGCWNLHVLRYAFSQWKQNQFLRICGIVICLALNCYNF